jgi:ligand-binding sensor domain-containing protein
MNILKKISILCLLCGIMVKTYGQKDGFFKNFYIEQGLPSDKIQGVTQDSEGFIWLGTNNGLVRFDGYEFRTYQSLTNTKESLSSDNVLHIEPDTPGNLWVGHYEAGIDYFNSKTGKVIFSLNSESQLPNDRISHLWHEKEKTRLWICTSRNMFVWYDKSAKKVIKKTPKSHPNNLKALPATNTIYDIFRSPNNKDQYWLATNDGLALYDEKTNLIRYYYFENGRSGYNTNDRLRGIVWLENKLWIGVRGGDGLISFDPKTEIVESFPFQTNSENSNLVIATSKKNMHEIWIGTIGHGLGVFNTQTKKYNFYQHNPVSKSSIAPGSVYKVFTDKKQNTWIVTNKGLSLFSPENQNFPLTKLPKNNTEIEKALTFIDDSQNLYIGLSKTNGLLVFNKKTQKYKTIPFDRKTPRSANILRFARDNAGNFWMSSSGYLYKYFTKTEKPEAVKLPKGFENILIHSIYHDKDNNLYLGTRISGLYKWNLKTNATDSLLKEHGGLVHNRFIHEILLDTKDRLWISSEKGISVIDRKSFKVIKNFGSDYGLNVIYRLALDKTGIMWASTENKGVVSINTNTLDLGKTITKADGLPTNAIQHLAIDKNDDLWIATQQGLCRFSKKDQDFQIFTYKNGLPENHLEASLNSLSDGKMIQGFDEGFSIFDPDKIIKSNLVTQPKIVNFSVFNNDIPLNTELRLEPNQNFIEITFSGLDFGNAQNIKYSYKLSGVDEKWVYPKKLRSVSYNNLEPGLYNFQVRSSFIGTQNWSEPTSLTFFIKAPFYKTIWFILLMAAILALMVYYFYKSKIDQVKKEERMQATLNKQLLTTELRALRSQMNPHFLYNCINSIKFYIIKNEPEQASTYLNKFSKLIRKFLTNSQFEFISLEEELHTLELYLEMEKLRFGDKMSFEINVDPNIEISFIKVPTMLIQPFLENAIWHGIMQKNESDGLLKLDILEIDPDHLKISIKDNGVGRKKAAELKSKSLNKNKSMGMNMTLARVAHLNEMNQTEIEIKTIDHLDENTNEPTGTEVVIYLKIMPINN